MLLSKLIEELINLNLAMRVAEGVAYDIYLKRYKELKDQIDFYYGG